MNLRVAVSQPWQKFTLTILVLAVSACATPLVQMYPGDARPADETAMIEVIDASGKLRVVVSSEGQTFRVASVLPGPVKLRLDLKKEVPDFTVRSQAVTQEEAAQGLGGGGQYNVKTRSMKRYLSFDVTAGGAYAVGARWVTAADRKDPLWYEGMKGERIRVWVTDETGKVVASDPACDGEALPGIREQPGCWFYPER